MKHVGIKEVTYSKQYKRHIIQAIMHEGFSIASICSQQGIEEPRKVREWVREAMKKRCIKRIPRRITPRLQTPSILISESVNRQFKHYEELIIYQESVIEAFWSTADKQTKKKLLKKLSPAQQTNLLGLVRK